MKPCVFILRMQSVVDSNNAGSHYTVIRHCRPGLSACCPPVQAYFLESTALDVVVVRAFKQAAIKKHNLFRCRITKAEALRTTCLRLAKLIVSVFFSGETLFAYVNFIV